jgi:hypothetical protein
MSDRLLKYLVGALAILAVAWGVARFVSGRGGTGDSAPFNLAASAGLELDSVVVEGPDATVRLRAGDGWTVNGHEAVADAGESLKRALEQAEVGVLVSRNPENHERLGVTEAEGRRLTVYAGGSEQLSLLIGARADVFDRAYARRVGDDPVYTLQGALVSLANRGVDEWRNKEILSLTRGDIQHIEFTYPDETFSLARDSLAWRIEPAGVAAEDGKVASLLSQLASLRAVSFAADAAADTLVWDPPSAQVRVLGPGGVVLGELSFLKREAEVGYFVRRAASPVVYTISSFTGGELLKRQADLAVAGEPASG